MSKNVFLHFTLMAALTCSLSFGVVACSDDDKSGNNSEQQAEGGTSLATVDMSIRQMPHLQQIVYCTPEQVGINASVPEWKERIWNFH